ncbi:hypothetical protein BDD43_0929 [Mucilaginibacter gracilis]|uniref:Uncharacterized protein n=1 Tax=Mucilaginibacter gracilis TaxID=423350 RepID=A0A495IXL3_9SPHI|nr:hypothetical protein BDD43_0929 [Mucilaginibacter gracilis]
MLIEPVIEAGNKIYAGIKARKAKLSFWQILNMNFGFFGLQSSVMLIV